MIPLASVLTDRGDGLVDRGEAPSLTTASGFQPRMTGTEDGPSGLRQSGQALRGRDRLP